MIQNRNNIRCYIKLLLDEDCQLYPWEHFNGYAVIGNEDKYLFTLHTLNITPHELDKFIKEHVYLSGNNLVL